jgi:hypothetical protein
MSRFQTCHCRLDVLGVSESKNRRDPTVEPGAGGIVEGSKAFRVGFCVFGGEIDHPGFDGIVRTEDPDLA